MSDEFYKEFDKLYLEIKDLLNNYCKSKILQNYFSNKLESFFYATLINNFFINLNSENVKEYNLPKGKIGVIKKKYKQIQNEINLALKFSTNKRTDVNFYNNFKLKIRTNYPEFQKIISAIEKEIDIKRGKKYLSERLKEITKIGKDEKDINAFFMTKILEVFVQKKMSLPLGNEIKKIMKQIGKEGLADFSHEVIKILKKGTNRMLISQRRFKSGFENRLYRRWKEALELLECLIIISLESGEGQQTKLSKTSDSTNNFKREALIKIHARALQISNEILILLKSGYPDGANSRWRSLHELAVISFFLLDENNDVSRRYLEHEIIRKFKEAKDYRTNYKKLGYPPIERKVFNTIKREKERLCRKYSDNFHEDYGWIPRSVLSDRKFRSLEKYVKLDKLRPFYNLSCDSVHGGAKGFYRLGLMDDYQDKILHVGASNYGLADPIQNTAISLMHVTTCLLVLEPDFENIIEMQIMNNYVNEVGIKAVNVQKQIENEESKKSK